MIKINLGDLPKMRLYNIYYLCKQYVSEVENVTVTEYRKTGGNEYGLYNWVSYKETLQVIRQIDCLSEYVKQLYDMVPVFVREDAEPKIDGNTKNRILSAKDIIVEKMETIIELYESMQLKETSKGIDVKIPPCDSLSEYISYMRDLDFIFEHCPFLQHSDGKIKFSTVDVGSQWISFVIAGSAAVYILNNLALLIDKAIQIKSHLISLRQQEEVLKSQKIGNQQLESACEIFESLKKYYVSEAEKEIENENPENALKDGEERGKAEKSLEKLSGLMEKGVEIYASIDNKQEVQVLFPALSEKIELPDNIIKYLEDKNSDD